jgi:hypothetical protein
MSDDKKLQQERVSHRHPLDKEIGTTADSKISEGENNLTHLLGRLCCSVGIHDDQVIDGTYGFGPGGNVERVICKRCGKMDTRWC